MSANWKTHITLKVVLKDHEKENSSQWAEVQILHLSFSIVWKEKVTQI